MAYVWTHISMTFVWKCKWRLLARPTPPQPTPSHPPKTSTASPLTGVDTISTWIIMTLMTHSRIIWITLWQVVMMIVIMTTYDDHLETGNATDDTSKLLHWMMQMMRKMVIAPTGRAVMIPHCWQRPITSVTLCYNDNDIEYKKDEDGPVWICAAP